MYENITDDCTRQMLLSAADWAGLRSKVPVTVMACRMEVLILANEKLGVMRCFVLMP